MNVITRIKTLLLLSYMPLFRFFGFLSSARALNVELSMHKLHSIGSYNDSGTALCARHVFASWLLTDNYYYALYIR